MKKTIYALFAAVVCFYSCQKVGEAPIGTVECLVGDCTENSVVLHYNASISAEGNAFQLGVFVATVDPMTSDRSKDVCGRILELTSGDNSGEVKIDGLQPGTNYFVRACILSDIAGQAVWSNYNTFTTDDPTYPSCQPIKVVSVGTTYASFEVEWEERGLKIDEIKLLVCKKNHFDSTMTKTVSGWKKFEVHDLEMATKYYVISYAITPKVLSISDMFEFTTLSPKVGTAVDLGLSVKWADINVGAFSPGEYGDYFAWGETAPKENYNLSTYKYFNSFHPAYTRYVVNDSFGNVDSKSMLDRADDAAAVNWGGNWRMPTRDEFRELLSECSWTFEIINGVNGYRVRSKKPGFTDKSIFLPSSGLNGVNGRKYVGAQGIYWSSNLETVNNTGAYALSVESADYMTTTSYYRLNGCTIRPVIK